VNVAEVMDELGTVLATIEGLRTFPYNADRITPPAAIVGWPDPISYDATMVRGADRMTLPLIVVVGRYDARNTRTRLAKYLDGAGADSVKTVLEAAEHTSFDSLRVTEARSDSYQIGGVEYLGAEFSLDIVGPGGS
jgi:hypothetical protein